MTSRRFAVNASPLILLAKIEAIDLLERLADELAIPAAVRDEVGDHPAQVREVLRRSRRSVRLDGVVPAEIAGWDLGAGESQVLTFAVAHSGYEAVVDDLDARNCARSLGVPLTGTLGVILRAKQAGLVEPARPLVEDLVQKGAFLSADLVVSSLAKVGE